MMLILLSFRSLCIDHGSLVAFGTECGLVHPADAGDWLERLIYDIIVGFRVLQNDYRQASSYVFTCFYYDIDLYHYLIFNIVSYPNFEAQTGHRITIGFSWSLHPVWRVLPWEMHQERLECGTV